MTSNFLDYGAKLDILRRYVKDCCGLIETDTLIRVIR